MNLMTSLRQKYSLSSVYSFSFLSEGKHLVLNIYLIRHIISKWACFVSYMCPYLLDSSQSLSSDILFLLKHLILKLCY